MNKKILFLLCLISCIGFIRADDGQVVVEESVAPVPEIVNEPAAKSSVEYSASEDDDDETPDLREADLLSAIDKYPLGDAVENQMDFIKLFTGKYYQGPYKTINEYLEKNVDELADIKTNMDATEVFLQKERARNPIMAAFREGLVEALEQFLDLRLAMLPENKCSRRSYATLFKNNMATNGEARKSKDKIGKLTRVNYIVRKYMIKHAVECRHVYPSIYGQKLDAMDQELVQRVNLFTSNLIQKKRKVYLFFDAKQTDDPLELIDQGRKITQIKGRDLAQATYHTIEHLAKHDPKVKYMKKVPFDKEQKYKVDEEQVRGLFEEYIAKPCETYVDEFGADIFLPASFDEACWKNLDPYERYRAEEEPNFLLGWIRYRMCNTLLTKDKEALIKGVIKVASGIKP